MDGGQIKVLLIENDSRTTASLKRIFSKDKRYTFDVECFEFLATGLERLNNGRIDVVLLDLMLPDSQSLETLEKVLTCAPKVPIVVLTSVEDETHAIKAVQMGAQDYLIKGQLNKNLLVRSLHYAIERKKTEEEFKKYQNKLEDMVKERTAELFRINEQLQQESTERKWLVEALRKSEKRFRNITLSMIVWIWEVNEKGVYTYCSERVQDILGYSPEEILGKMIFDFMLPSDSIRIRERFSKISARKEPIKDLENWHIHKDGSRVCLLTNGVPVLDKRGNLKGYRGVNKDITDRKMAEESLKEANERLKELDQLKNQFLSTVSHEIRTPIAIMREGVSLCLDGVAGEITKTQKELLTYTLQSIDRLTRLVSNLLDISKIEAGKEKLSRYTVDLCELVKKIKNCFEPQAREKGIQLLTSLPEGALKLYVDGDKVTQIFNNFINNAIRFTEAEGEITIQIIEKKDTVECSVSDTGIGIAEKNIPKLFSKFEQFGRVEGPGYRGTGLGLAIAKGLVEKHDGKIWVNSKLNKGTTFWFTLKKVPFPKILIVDDEKHIVEMIKASLHVDNYRFVEANDGVEAVAKAQREAVSLIILDMTLPKMSGYEVIGRLKQDMRTHKIPIIIVSGFFVDEKRVEQVNDHAYIPIIPKPFLPEELRNRVRDMLMEE